MQNKYGQGGYYTPGREARWWQGVLVAIDMIKKSKSKKSICILDVGCGDGSYLKILNKLLDEEGIVRKRVKYYGVDNDVEYKKYIDENNGHFILGDIMNLSGIVGSHKFDLIVASEIIEHVDETDSLVDSIKSVLKPSGLIFLTTPNLAAWHSRIMLLFGYQPLATEISNLSSSFGKGGFMDKYYSRPIHHIRVFTYRAMIEFVKYHDLKVVKSIGGGYRWYDNLLFGNIFKGLSPVIIMILARK